MEGACLQEAQSDFMGRVIKHLQVAANPATS